MLKFSIVLPAYKARFLDASIKSILSQIYPHFELIVVDDASLEDLKSIVDANKDNRVSYYRNKENIGGRDLVAQWNRALSYAKNEYIVLATDDDLYDCNFLSNFVPLIEKYPEVDLFRARLIFIDAKNDIKLVEQCYPEYMPFEEFTYNMQIGRAHV